MKTMLELNHTGIERRNTMGNFRKTNIYNDSKMVEFIPSESGNLLDIRVTSRRHGRSGVFCLLTSTLMKALDGEHCTVAAERDLNHFCEVQRRDNEIWFHMVFLGGYYDSLQGYAEGFHFHEDIIRKVLNTGKSVKLYYREIRRRDVWEFSERALDALKYIKENPLMKRALAKFMRDHGNAGDKFIAYPTWEKENFDIRCLRGERKLFDGGLILGKESKNGYPRYKYGICT